MSALSELYQLLSKLIFMQNICIYFLKLEKKYICICRKIYPITKNENTSCGYCKIVTTHWLFHLLCESNSV